MKQLNIRVHSKLALAIKKAAHRKETSQARFIIDALNAYLYALKDEELSVLVDAAVVAREEGVND